MVEAKEPTFPGAGERLPYFSLADTRGGTTDPWRYRGRRNLVLLFVDSGDCAGCREVLRDFGARYREYVEEEAEVLALARLPLADTQALAASLGLPFPLLADAEGAVHTRYGAQGPTVYVADRYGEIQERWLGDGHRSPPDQEQVLDRLRFIGIQCPE